MIKTCVTCKHHEQRGLDATKRSSYYCKAAVDEVTGIKMIVACIEMRDDVCGPEGKLWEEIPNPKEITDKVTEKFDRGTRVDGVWVNSHLNGTDLKFEET